MPRSSRVGGEKKREPASRLACYIFDERSILVYTMTQNTKVFTSKLHNSDTRAELLKTWSVLIPG